MLQGMLICIIRIHLTNQNRAFETMLSYTPEVSLKCLRHVTSVVQEWLSRNNILFIAKTTFQNMKYIDTLSKSLQHKIRVRHRNSKQYI